MQGGCELGRFAMPEHVHVERVRLDSGEGDYAGR